MLLSALDDHLAEKIASPRRPLRREDRLAEKAASLRGPTRRDDRLPEQGMCCCLPAAPNYRPAEKRSVAIPLGRLTPIRSLSQPQLVQKQSAGVCAQFSIFAVLYL